MGVKEEPTLTPIASKIIKTDVFSLRYFLKNSVRGITIKRAMSFVRKVERKTETKTINKDIPLSVLYLLIILLVRDEKYPLSLIPVVIIRSPVREIIVFIPEETKKSPTLKPGIKNLIPVSLLLFYNIKIF